MLQSGRHTRFVAGGIDSGETLLLLRLLLLLLILLLLVPVVFGSRLKQCCSDRIHSS